MPRERCRIDAGRSLSVSGWVPRLCLCTVSDGPVAASLAIRIPNVDFTLRTDLSFMAPSFNSLSCAWVDDAAVDESLYAKSPMQYLASRGSVSS